MKFKQSLIKDYKYNKYSFLELRNFNGLVNNKIVLINGKNNAFKYNNTQKNKYCLFFFGIYGCHYLLLNDLLFIKTLEFLIYYNKLILKKNFIKRLILQKIIGSMFGWFVELQIIGLGFRAKLHVLGYLLLNLGYSHIFAVKIINGLNILINKDKILIFGLDLLLLGNFVNKIIKLRPIDAYKGKGINLKVKKIILKEGKKQKL